ncbi:n-acetylglutamate synthase [Persicobacter psychrovividus]|uniref:N-acetylglutamate synthase n=1 Tax=Persicobacter psychrovividus TaxID=387638 RepID=A0ABM7VDZ9_9BACT|nr:hypothetical protein PEPS_14650 [Persicobacter psychrovividus]
MNYDQKFFRVSSNANNGEITTDTIFKYNQLGDILMGEYSGGMINRGQLIGKVDADGNINMRYQQINTKGELMTGECQSRPELLPNGKIRLHEKWQWTSGDYSSGTSILEEI